MSAGSDYLAALLRARQRALAINLEEGRAIQSALYEYAQALLAKVAKLPAGADRTTRELAARRSAAIIREQADQLGARLEAVIAQGRGLAFRDTLRIWSGAQVRVLEAADLGQEAALVGAVQSGRLTIAQAFAAQVAAGGGPATWRTLLRGHVQNAEREAARVVTGALVRGEHPEQVARALERYVTGRERYPDVLSPELHGEPVRTAGAGYSMQHNARRIAFSETHTARKEAEVQHFMADGYIVAVRWTLSPARGTQRQPDVCDALAALDWHGLGSGIFPLRQVPMTPHPFDRCEMVPLVARQVPALAGRDPRAPFPLVLSPASAPLPGLGQMTPNAAARTRQRLAEILVGAPR